MITERERILIDAAQQLAESLTTFVETFGDCDADGNDNEETALANQALDHWKELSSVIR